MGKYFFCKDHSQLKPFKFTEAIAAYRKIFLEIFLEA